MQYHWLNNQNNDKLIVFFAGWSFDYVPFEFLSYENYDVLMIYDYNSIVTNKSDLLQLVNNYKNKYLLAWSMGVFVAYQLRNLLPEFDHKIAINGTPYPVNDEFGIPQKPFILTLRHAKTGLEGKFYQNIFNKEEEFEKYLKTPVERTIENRVSELNELYKNIKDTKPEYEDFYDKAYVSLNDKIIPPKNQIDFWQKYNVPYKTLESGHFPYYNFNSWKELL